MIQLKLLKAHRSITGLLPTTLPDFAVVTGINGSGKSHLLQAIHSGAIVTTGIPHGDEHIRLFTWANMSPKRTGAADPIEWSRRRAAAIKDYLTKIEGAKLMFYAQVTALNVAGLPERDTGTLMSLNKATFQSIQAQGNDSRDLWQQFENSRNALNVSIRNAFHGDDAVTRSVLQWTKHNEVPLWSFTEADFERALPLDWTPVDAFHQNLSQLFAAYYKAFDKNRYRRYRANNETENITFLTDEQFLSRFGEPPWNFVNRLLEEAHLNYTITHPTGDPDLAFEAKLINRLSNTEVSFQDLSSGEQILVAFVHCLYSAKSTLQNTKYPKLLLLDEIDAPLHPSMAKDLIRVIDSVLVKDKGVKVIMTTHSPATVAFAPTGSLFRLERQPRRQLVASTKEEAIQALTSGYISVTDNSRFVITEAKRDRQFYTALFKTLVDQNNVDRSPNLVFVQASDTKDLTGGGREQVKQWGKKLSEAGLSQIMGLIDRDLNNIAQDKIKVLCRYSIENYVLDPLILYAVAMNRGAHEKIMDVGIPHQNFFQIVSLEQSKLQSIFDTVCALLENQEPQLKAFSGTFEIEYVCGRKIVAPVWLRDFRGHDLTRVVREAFRGRVANDFIITQDDCKDIEEMICLRLPQFISTDYVRIFKALQTA